MERRNYKLTRSVAHNGQRATIVIASFASLASAIRAARKRLPDETLSIEHNGNFIRDSYHHGLPKTWVA